MRKELEVRSEGKCELCGSQDLLNIYPVSPKTGNYIEELAYICTICKDQLEGAKEMDANHWRCLNESMWSDVPAIKVLAWRVLNELKSEGWPLELLEMMYLEDDLLEWAKSSISNDDSEIKHIDSNGAVLSSGDSVVLIKDLDVKGANFIAKRGTPVRNINLVHDNPEHIEGRVNGQKIVILTKFVKK